MLLTRSASSLSLSLSLSFSLPFSVDRFSLIRLLFIICHSIRLQLSIARRTLVSHRSSCLADLSLSLSFSRRWYYIYIYIHIVTRVQPAAASSSMNKNDHVNDVTRRMLFLSCTNSTKIFQHLPQKETSVCPHGAF